MYKNSDSTLTSTGLGGSLRRLREQRALPLRAVAAATGMDQAHLSKAELGQRLPTAAQTGALARFFQQDPVEWEARRIAQKFRQEHSDNPAAARAVLLLHTGGDAEAVPPNTGEPAAPADRSVMILHAD
ncbi:MAG: helix-turn-helix transcriptional regulator [Pseudomonadota bacterium]